MIKKCTISCYTKRNNVMVKLQAQKHFEEDSRVKYRCFIVHGSKQKKNERVKELCFIFNFLPLFLVRSHPNDYKGFKLHSLNACGVT